MAVVEINPALEKMKWKKKYVKSLLPNKKASWIRELCKSISHGLLIHACTKWPFPK